MVSPCKNDDSQNQNVRYCFPGKNKSPKNTAVKATVTRKLRIKPLANRIFYLDLKNRKDSEYLEAALQSFGAVIAIFLDRSVTHIISDRPASGLGCSRTLASPAASVSPYLSHSPIPSDRYSLPRSRGAAMLERVSLSITNAGYVDPISFAQQWHVPVLSPARIRAELADFESLSKGKPPRERKAKGDFIKLEALVGSWKPDLLSLERWPELDLDSPAGELPFQWGDGHGLTPAVRRGKFHRNTMTRRPYKSSSNSEDDATVSANNKKKSLCNGHTPVKSSTPDDLKVQCNGLSSGLRKSNLLSPSGSDVLPLPTQRRSTRRTSASWCGSTRELSQLSPPLSPQLVSPGSPSDSELGVTLRPKGTLWLPVALIGTTAEEHGNCIRRRGGSDASLNSLDASKPRRKKLSPEEKLLQDNKDYFKMEMFHTKLRSSGPKQLNHGKNGKIPARCKRARWAKTKESGEDEQDRENVVVTPAANMKVNGVQKPKRSRQSELTTLCDEAETFMFGESTRQSVAESEEETRREDGASCDENGPPRKKRRSHAEAFIHDNLDYYKFETPGSRLRSQGSAAGDPESSPVEGKSSELIFSFEAVPSSEPWYDVFRRQDEGNEVTCPVISDPANQLFLLPYELPRFPHPRPDAPDYYVKRRLRLAQIVAQNHPRKSPRCHASTLAILSSLKRRKRRSSASAGTAEPEPTTPSKDDILSQLDRINDEPFEEILMLDPGDVEPPTASTTTARRKKTEERLVLRAANPIPIGPQPSDVLELVTSYWDSPHPDLLNTPNAGSPRRTRRRRKARFNKTGWDKAKTRARKAQRAQQEAVAGSTPEKKTATSPKRSPPSVTLPCVVRVRKLSHSLCRKLSMKRRRRRSGTDYSWTTKKR